MHCFRSVRRSQFSKRFSMKLLSRLICAAAVAGASVTTASAQNTVTDPWSFGLGVNGSYEGNALFTGPDGNEEFAHMLQATLGRGWAFRRGGASLAGNVSQ